MTVTYKLFKILSRHDVANGRTDRRTDRLGPYHNTSEVLHRAYNKLTMQQELQTFVTNNVFLDKKSKTTTTINQT